MDKLQQLFAQQSTVMTVINIVMTLASSVFFLLAVSTDTKINHIKHRRLWCTAAFIFNILGTAVYFAARRYLKQEVASVCTKCGKKAPRDGSKVCKKCGNTRFTPQKFENRGEARNRIIACLIVAVILHGVNYWVANYSPMAQSIEEESSYGLDMYDDEDVFE